MMTVPPAATVEPALNAPRAGPDGRQRQDPRRCAQREWDLDKEPDTDIHGVPHFPSCRTSYPVIIVDHYRLMSDIQWFSI
jgi:hypothetical protein